MKTMIKMVMVVTAVVMATGVFAQDRTFKDGSVWAISMIKTNAGMGENYLNSLKTTWKAVHDEAIKQGLVLSYKILSGGAANPDDWDVLLLVEYKDLASMEGNDDKWDAIYKKVVGDAAATKQLMDTRVSMRTIYGEKLMREVVYK
jgi:hypothetical protein